MGPPSRRWLMQRRIRVLHIVNDLNYGGMERIIAEIARRTDPARFETHVMGLDYLGHFATGLDEFATLHVASPMTKCAMIRPAALARDIRRIGPDVVHAHSGVWYKGSLAAKLAGVPFQIYTDHGRQSPDPWINRTLDRVASRRTDVVVAVSGRLGEHLSGFVADPRRVCVVANGVDTTRYAPHPDNDNNAGLRAELGLESTQPIIGSVGRLEPVKGYGIMVAAFALLLRTWSGGPPPALVLVGDGSERASLERAARADGIAGNIHFLGWRSDIERCINAFTIFSMSSHSEGTSISLLEAMSSGLCPVVTDVGGNPAVLGETLRHRLVDAAAPEALASSWREALGDGERRAADGAAARTRVIEHFGLDTMVREYESIYQSTPIAARS